MNYKAMILEELLKNYEKRKPFLQQPQKRGPSPISYDVTKLPSYTDRYNLHSYEEINAAIEVLIGKGFIRAKPLINGAYHKLNLNEERVTEVYQYLHRIPLPKRSASQMDILTRYDMPDNPLVHYFCSACWKKARRYEKLPYNIGFNNVKLENILRALIMLTQLEEETYIRNFSLALFNDSKMLENCYLSTIQSILYDFTDQLMEQKRITEVYNLYHNPSYVILKGNAILETKNSHIHLSDFPGGIGIAEKSLPKLTSVIIQSDKVITIENLTTFHTATGEETYIYLGGYHNRVKQDLLKLIYTTNKEKTYYHQGDIDFYGFSILNNLREKTGIPFHPLDMDVETLAKVYDNHLYKPLTKEEIATLKEQPHPWMAEFVDVFQFMLEHNCKQEQEALAAIDLLQSTTILA